MGTRSRASPGGDSGQLAVDETSFGRVLGADDPARRDRVQRDGAAGHRPGVPVLQVVRY